jgi:hypothetical protein
MEPSLVWLFSAQGVVAALAGMYFLAQWLWYRPLPLATEEAREEWYQYLRTDVDMRLVRDSTTADFLLAESKYLVAQKIDAIKTSEAKAAAQLGIVGGGIGLLAIFGPAQSTNLPGLTTALICGAVMLFLSIAVNLLCISLGRTDVLPSIDVYNLEKTARLPEMKARISVSLTEGYVDYSSELTGASRTKGRLQKIASFFFVLGVLSLAINYGIKAAHQGPPQPTGVRCEPSGTGFICKELPK